MDFIYILPYLMMYLKGTFGAWNSSWEPRPGTTVDQYFMEEFRNNRIDYDFAKNLADDRETYKEVCRDYIRYSVGGIFSMTLDHPILCSDIAHLHPGINYIVRLKNGIEAELPAPDLLFCDCGYHNGNSLLSDTSFLARNKAKGYFTFTLSKPQFFLDPNDHSQTIYEIEKYWPVDKYNDIVQRLRRYKPTLRINEINFPVLDELLERSDLDWSETDLSRCISTGKPR